ncbi:MAG: D-TA family PLP-dependent enzyme [Inquilinus sp.]|nr:D-TA family PLP-dependent enzyme [Inquilinus sp.]
MRIDDLDTPCVVIDLDRVDRNLRRFQTYCDDNGLANRPHVKTHKIPEFARRQVALGAGGIVCQKLGEAEVMADAGLDDILIPYNLVGAHKLRRAVALARRVTLSLTCDSEATAEGLSAAFDQAGLTVALSVECDTGAKRCGVQSPAEAAALARRIDALPGLTFAGLMTYPSPGSQHEVQAFLTEAVAECAAAGLRADVVSNGGSPDMWTAHTVAAATEHRAGTYIYYDRSMVAFGAASLDDCALRVRATVVSRPTADRVIVDAGSKTISSDIINTEGHCTVLEYPAARLSKLSEEHGHLDFSGESVRPAIGEILTIVPNHACAVSNLHDVVHGVVGDDVERSYPVAARGRVV